MIKLYDTEPYATEFDAVITGVRRDGGSAVVTLDRTLFFPEEGGQSPDSGTLAGYPVADVQIKGEEIFHTLTVGDGDASSLAEGAKVHGEIDWEYRYRNMQMHSGEHIFSGLVHARFGYDNVGFHLSDRSATMDYNGKMTEEDVRALELEANRIIVSNREIRAWYASAEELAERSYRSKKELTGAVRLVEIDGVDLCACCAPHVRVTGEIGCFKVVAWENYKGGVRVHFRCGFRAMEEFGEALASITAVSRTLSVEPANVAEAVAKLQAENRDLAYEAVALQREIVTGRVEALAAEARNMSAGITDGRLAKDAVLFLKGRDAAILRFAVNELEKHFSGVCAAFLQLADGSWRYILEQEGGDVSHRQQILRERFGAKGGGPGHSAQGSVNADEAALRDAME